MQKKWRMQARLRQRSRFEGWLPRLVKSAGGKASVVTATTGIAPLKLGSEADPHAWQSVATRKSMSPISAMRWQQQRLRTPKLQVQGERLSG
jgi:ABC-type metal ion transport system, periplasmic component/surface adhesin